MESTGRSGEWHIIVVPKSYTLGSPRSQSINDKILFRATSKECRTAFNLDALVSLNYAIGMKISEILKEDSDGLLSINEAEIPSGRAFQDKDAPVLSGLQPPASSVETFVRPSSSEPVSPVSSVETLVRPSSGKPASPAGSIFGAFNPRAKYDFSPPPCAMSFFKRRKPGVSKPPTKSSLLPPPPTKPPLRGGAYDSFNFVPGPNFGFPSSFKAENTDSDHSPETPDSIPLKDTSATLDSAEKQTSAEQPTIEDHVEDATYEIIPTPGTSVVSDSDSDTIKSGSVDVEPYRQMVKDEIELAMDGLLGRLAESFREIRKTQQKTVTDPTGSSRVVDLNVDDILGYLVETFEGMRGGLGLGLGLGSSG